MTATNNEIRMALNDRLEAQLPAYDGLISYPGVDFMPPSAGIWLEVSFFPNRGIDQGLPYDSDLVPQGIYQVMVMGWKSQQNEIKLGVVAQVVKAAFAKGTVFIAPSYKVNKHPYEMEMITQDAKVMMPVTIEYKG